MAETIGATKDTHIRNRLDANTNFGDAAELRIGREPMLQQGRGLFTFDLSAYDGMVVDAAILSFYVSLAAASAIAGKVNRVTEGWLELEATWLHRESFVEWSKAGGTYTEADGVDWAFPTATGWKEIDLGTVLAQDAIDNRAGQLQIIVRDAVDVLGWFEAYSTDYASAAWRPKLTLTVRPGPVGPPYTVEAGEVFVSGAASGTIHLAGAETGEAYTPTAQAGEVYAAGAIGAEANGGGAVAGSARIAGAAMGELYVAGVMVGDIHTAQAATGEAFVAGIAASEAGKAGALAGQAFAPGAVAAETS